MEEKEQPKLIFDEWVHYIGCTPTPLLGMILKSIIFCTLVAMKNYGEIVTIDAQVRSFFLESSKRIIYLERIWVDCVWHDIKRNS